MRDPIILDKFETITEVGLVQMIFFDGAFPIGPQITLTSIPRGPIIPDQAYVRKKRVPKEWQVEWK